MSDNPALNWLRVLGILLLIVALGGWVVDTALSGFSYLLSTFVMRHGAEGYLFSFLDIIGSLLLSAALAVVGIFYMAQAKRSVSGTADTLTAIGDLALAVSFLVEGFSQVWFLMFNLMSYNSIGFSFDVYFAVSSLINWVDLALLLAAGVLYIIAAVAGGQALRGKPYLVIAGVLLALVALMLVFYSQLFDILSAVIDFGAMTILSILLSAFLGLAIAAGIALRAFFMIKR
jgi:hypothetical protein